MDLRIKVNEFTIMKNLITCLICLTLSFDYVQSMDIVCLRDGSKIKGELINVEPGKLTFQPNKKKLDLFILTSDQVEYVKVNDIQKIFWIQENMYLKGFADADIYHKRFGGNFCAGFFGGAIGFIIVAATDAKLPDPTVVGQENFNNTQYLMGYNKKAKGKNMAAVGAGWAVSLLVLLLKL